MRAGAMMPSGWSRSKDMYLTESYMQRSGIGKILQL